MKKRIIEATFVLIMLLTALSRPALAQSEPIAGCPNGFELHQANDHHDMDIHNHVGTSTDQNGDGWICVKHVSPNGSIHVHIDNTVKHK